MTSSTAPNRSERGAARPPLAETLAALSRIERLSRSPWMQSRLVARVLAERPGCLQTDALRIVLTRALAQLERESPWRADLLRGRYWEGLTVPRMVELKRPRPWQERNFSRRQTDAINRLETILTEWEHQLVLAQEGPAEPASGRPPLPTAFGSIRSSRAAFPLLLAVAIGALLYSMTPRFRRLAGPSPGELPARAGSGSSAEIGDAGAPATSPWTAPQSHTSQAVASSAARATLPAPSPTLVFAPTKRPTMTQTSGTATATPGPPEGPPADIAEEEKEDNDSDPEPVDVHPTEVQRAEPPLVLP